MDRRFLATVLIVLSVFPAAVLGCGDKFLVASRNTRYQRAPVSRGPASILIYESPASEISKGLAGIPVDATLRKVGYQPTIVETADEFDRALARGGWNLVLVGNADAEAVAQRVKNLGVLPVAYKPTREQLKQSKKLFPVVLQGPTKGDDLVAAVDDALASLNKHHQKSGKTAS